jgi:hypothetical protein
VKEGLGLKYRFEKRRKFAPRGFAGLAGMPEKRYISRNLQSHTIAY